MANAFSAQQVQLMAYGEEEVTYTWGPGTALGGLANQTTVFDISGWNTPGTLDYAAILTSLSATQNASVQLLWTYDGNTSDTAQGWTDAMPSGMRPMPIYAPAVDRLSLVIQNTSGAPILNYQLNYTVRVKRLTLAEKFLLQRTYTPSAEETQLAELLGPTTIADIQARVANGDLPMDVRLWNQALVRPHRLGDPTNAVPRHFVVGVTGTAQAIFRPTKGNALLVESIAAEGAQNARVVLNRDGVTVPNSGYVDVQGTAFVQTDDAPWPYIVWATQFIQAQVIASAGTYTVRLGMREVKLSTLLAQHLGLERTATAQYAQVRLGLA